MIRKSLALHCLSWSLLGAVCALVAIPASAADAFDAAVAHGGRSQADLKRDPLDHPAEILRLAGIKPGMRVADVLAGDGYYSELASYVVGPQGKPAKQPMYIHRLDGEPLAVAGLWETWRDPADPDGGRLHSCTVITTAANATMAPVHDRMPVILPPSAWGQWLDHTNDDVAALGGLLLPAPGTLLTMHPVSNAVNFVREKGSELIAPVEPRLPA